MFHECSAVTCQYKFHIYFTAGRGVNYCDRHIHMSLMSESMSLYLPTSISQGREVQTSPDFWCMFPVATTESSSGGTAICCVLPVLWMKQKGQVLKTAVMCIYFYTSAHVVAGGILFYCRSFFLSFFSFTTGSPRWLDQQGTFLAQMVGYRCNFKNWVQNLGEGRPPH